MLPSDNFLFILCLSTVIGLNLGGYIRRERGCKMRCLPCRFRGSFNRNLSGCSKNKQHWKIVVLEVRFAVLIKQQISEYSMGPLPLLSEDEEQLLVTWIMTVPKKEFLIGTWSSSLFVKEFLTVNQRKPTFKDNVPGGGRFWAFLHCHPCPLSLLKT